METSAALAGLDCTDCGAVHDPSVVTHRCPDCGGILDPGYDLDAVDLDGATLSGRPFRDMWRYAELLAFPAEAAVSLGEGATPAVDCPALADELGVARVVVKDEGANPTGTFKDRGQAAAVTAAREHGADEVALATAGNAGQAAAAYAARAGLEAHVFVPSRAGFTQKAMVNVHGADMRVVEGRLDDAGAVLADALADDEGWYPLSTFETPYRHDGKKTIYFELVEQLDWTVPDHVVFPTGGGVGLVGMAKGAREFATLGLTDGVPAFHAAQSTGCGPIAEAFDDGRERHEPWDVPDTICAGIEVPDPAGSALVLDAVRETGGRAVATDDEQILDAAATVASHEGLEVGATAAAAASGAWALADDGAFDADDTVALVNTGAGNKDADVLRSHLMGRGV